MQTFTMSESRSDSAPPSPRRYLPAVPRFLPGLVLIALGLFLYTRLANGTLYFYISQRFAWLTLAAALGLMLVGAALWMRGRMDGAAHDHARGGDPDHAHDEHADEIDPEHADDGSHAHGAEHGHTRAAGHDHVHAPVTWLGIGLIALPIVLGLLVPPRPLGASAMAGRELNVASLSGGAAADRARLRAPAGERNILDWLIAFQGSADVTAFDGQAATVVGFVFPGAEAGSDQAARDSFMISRFVVSCCAADASPVSLVVRWPQAPELPADAWVKVGGSFEVTEVDGRTVPILVADSVEIVQQPDQPYLYP